jgi:hypothetical protein
MSSIFVWAKAPRGTVWHSLDLELGYTLCGKGEWEVPRRAGAIHNFLEACERCEEEKEKDNRRQIA